MQSGTTTEKNLSDYSKANNLAMKPVVFETQEATNKAYFSGRCQAYTTDASGLASVRNKEAGNPEDHVILPELISKEPLGPSVRRGDDEFFTIVKWVVFALIEAEEYGIAQANVDGMHASSTDPVVQRILGTSEDTGKLLGLDKDWAYRAIKSVGNYGEIFERNVGPKSALQAAARRQQSVEQGRPHVRAARALADSAAGRRASSRASGVLVAGRRPARPTSNPRTVA